MSQAEQFYLDKCIDTNPEVEEDVIKQLFKQAWRSNTNSTIAMNYFDNMLWAFKLGTQHMYVSSNRPFRPKHRGAFDLNLKDQNDHSLHDSEI